MLLRRIGKFRPAGWLLCRLGLHHYRRNVLSYVSERSEAYIWTTCCRRCGRGTGPLSGLYWSVTYHTGFTRTLKPPRRQ